jgi:hypothetical protein
MLDLHWFDFVGFAGVLLVLGAYFLLQTGRMRGDRVPYSLVNAIGAAGILVPVWYAKEMNWSVLFIEAAWILISLYGVWHSLSRRAKAPPPAPG